MKIGQTIRNWSLPVAMGVGVSLYFLGDIFPLSAEARHSIMMYIPNIQAFLIFLMLFITFMKVDTSQVRLHRWHFAALAFQATTYIALCLLSIHLSPAWRVVVEGAMLCMICPTATAAVVITGKLGGNEGSLTTYTILVNILVALVVPVSIPLLYPASEGTTLTHFLKILLRVSPMLVLPILSATLVRRIRPGATQIFRTHKNLAFYIWCISLSLVMSVTTRSIVKSEHPVIIQATIAIVSLFACALQFGMGKWMGAMYDHTTEITAGQALGQKNTVFAIWMGNTFLDPVSSVAGGFYIFWHNIFNSWQLYRLRKANKSK